LGSLLWPAGEKLVVIGGRGDVDTISGAACGLAVVDARRHFQCEYPRTWPQEVLAKFVTQEEIAESAQLTTRAERDALLAECVIAVVSWPYPLDLRSRCPKLRWVHSVNAGVSNFRSPFEGKASDVWGSGVKLTSSRGSNFALPIAEYALGCIFLAGKCFAQAWRDKQAGAFERTRYRPVLIRGKTLGIIGHGTPHCRSRATAGAALLPRQRLGQSVPNDDHQKRCRLSRRRHRAGASPPRPRRRASRDRHPTLGHSPRGGLAGVRRAAAGVGAGRAAARERLRGAGGAVDAGDGQDAGQGTVRGEQPCSGSNPWPSEHSHCGRCDQSGALPPPISPLTSGRGAATRR